MAITQHRSYKKPTGARYISSRNKRKYEIGRLPAMTKIGEKRVSEIRPKGGGKKLKMFAGNIVNLLDPKTKKYTKATIKTVVESAANRHFIRRNILTKGAVVDTDKGKAKITSRPGQEGSINAVLVSE